MGGRVWARVKGECPRKRDPVGQIKFWSLLGRNGQSATSDFRWHPATRKLKFWKSKPWGQGGCEGTRGVGLGEHGENGGFDGGGGLRHKQLLQYQGVDGGTFALRQSARKQRRSPSGRGSLTFMIHPKLPSSQLRKES